MSANQSGSKSRILTAIENNWFLLKLTVKKLKNESLEGKDEYGNTALHLAATNGELDTVKYLVERNVNIECLEMYERTPLHLAVIYGHLDIVKYLVYKNVNLNCLDQYHKTPLHYAVEKNYYDIFELLVNKKANLEIMNLNGRTPLHMALKLQRLSLLQCLVDNYANLDIPDNKGDIPIKYAIKSCDFKMLRYFGNGNANLECTDNNGRTLLHSAVSEHGNYITKFLIEQNVNIDCQDQLMKTPLHYAVVCNKYDMVKYLVEKGANRELRDTDGKMALDLAYSCSIEELLEDPFKIPLKNRTIYKSNIDELILMNIDDSILCKIQDIRGIHLLEYPVKLKCGHSVCMRCIIEKMSKNSLNIFFCCVKNTAKLTKEDLLNYNIYNQYSSLQNSNSIALFNSILKTVDSGMNLLIEETRSYEETGLKFSEEEIDIRLDSIKQNLKLLKVRIISNIDKVKERCKDNLKMNIRKNVYAFDNLICLKHAKLSMKKLWIKDVGHLKIAAKHNFGDRLPKIRTIKGLLRKNNAKIKEDYVIECLELARKKTSKPLINLITELESLILSVGTHDDLISLNEVLSDICSKYGNNKKSISNEKNNNVEIEQYLNEVLNKLRIHAKTNSEIDQLTYKFNLILSFFSD